MKFFNPLLQSPEKAFLVLGLLGGVLVLTVTPPFQVADEYGHFVRAYQISEGSLTGIRQGDSAGDILPKSLSVMADLLSPGMSTYEQGNGIPHHPERKFDLHLLNKAFQIPLNPSEKQFSIFPNTVLYWPATYFPEALAIYFGRQIHLPPLSLFYLGRITHLFLSLALGFYTLRIMPTGKWCLVLLMLTPMAMYQRSSASGDAMMNSLSFLYIALALKFILLPNQILNLKSVMALGILASLVALAKQAYFLMPLLLFLIPGESFGGKKKKMASLLLILMIAWGGIVAWSWHIKKIATPQVEGANPVQQLSFIIANRILFLKIIMDPLIPFTLLKQYIGWLGWADIHFPVFFYCLAYAVLFFVGLCDVSIPLTLNQRIFFLALVYTSYLLIVSLIYLTGMKVGAINVVGIQGRYLIPFLPLLFVACQCLKPGQDPLQIYVPKVAIAWQMIAILFTTLFLLGRFYWTTAPLTFISL